MAEENEAWAYGADRTVAETAGAINGGKRFTPTSGIRAADVNAMVESVLWSVDKVYDQIYRDYNLRFRVNDAGELVVSYYTPEPAN